MLNSNKFKALFLASLMCASTFVSACSAKKIDGDIQSGSQQTEPTENQVEPTKTDPNIPDNILESPESKTQPTEPSASVPESSESDAPQITDPASSETEPTEPPPQTVTTSDTTSSNEQGEIIDDWDAGLDLSSQNPDELYETFGVDRSHREGYYRMISGESEFPIIHVSTANQKEILSLDDYLDCFVEVFNCDDVYKLDAASAGIRVRGNASANYGKVDWIRKNTVSYRIKFDNSQSMLGLNDFARCRSWVLLKSYEAAIENHLAFKVAKAINNGDYFCSDSVFVQLYVNEEYKGVYLLCEQTQANSERIDLNEAKDNYTGTDIGYLVELDNYATGDDHPYFWLTYNKEKISDVYGTERVPRKYAYSVKNDLYSDEQLKFIERYFEVAWEIPMRAIRDGEYYKLGENFELIPAQDEFASAQECISQVFDIDSVVDMYITYEIINDQDVGGGSFFFAVDFGQGSKYEKLTMVAPWDFDWAYYDYSSDADGGLYAAAFKDSYFVEHWGDRSNPWLILFYSADWFRELVKQKWQERLPYIKESVNEVEDLVVNYSDEFNRDGTRRSGGAMTTIKWVRNRLDYLNTLWG